MPRGRFTEKEIRDAILRKIDPKIEKSRAAHDTGYISLEGKTLLRFKIPNPHKKDFYPNKAKRLADSLKLNFQDEFHDLIACPLTGAKYYELLRARVKA